MEPKTDRRIRKTKKQLRQGLANLMSIKSINEITVKELVEEVDINRSTFYLHYTDIYDMLEKIENELMEEIMSIITFNDENLKDKEDSYPYLVKLFTMLNNNRDICKALVGPHGDMSFVAKIEEYISKNTEQYSSKLFQEESQDDMKYIHAYCITGCVGMIKTWITDNPTDSPEHIAEVTSNMLINTFKSYINT